MKQYLYIIFGVLVISVTGLLLIITKLSPEDFPFLADILFFICFFLSVFSLLTLLGYSVRRVTTPKINKAISFTLSFRQGILLSAFTCISMYLLHLRAFTWWAAALILWILMLIELGFLLKEG